MQLLLALAVLGTTQTVTYDGNVLPDKARPPWSFRHILDCSVDVQDGTLHVRDQGTARGCLQFISYGWGARNKRPHYLEARVKVSACSGPAGVILLAADGVREIGLTLYPDRIEVHRLGAQARTNLSDDFHLVRIEMQGDDARVLVDGRPLLNLAGKSTWAAHAGRNVVGFGSLSSPATGEAWWDYVTWRADQPDVHLWPGATHHIVYKQKDVYACFPSLYQYQDGTLITSFGTRVRRSHIDSRGGTMRMISRDGGVTWKKAYPAVPYYNPAALRADGSLAIANAIGWQYADEKEAGRLKAKRLTVRTVRPGTIAYLSGARSMVRSVEGRVIRRWTPIDVPAGGGMMNFNQSSYLNAGDGVRLVAIYDTGPDNRRSAYVLRTADDGNRWVCLPMALGNSRLSFNETALAANRAGVIVALMRTAESSDRRAAGYLYQVVSTDAGKSWSAPVNTGIWGYPAHLLRLPDGRLVATYGYRRAPMGIHACLSRDGGKSWDVENEIVLRADGYGSGSDLGYPVTQRLTDGTLATIYYFNGKDNVTHICLTRWKPPK